MKDKKEKPTTEQTYEYDNPSLGEEQRELIHTLNSTLGNSNTSLEEKTKYTVALELFKLSLLPLITDLDKEKVETLTRHDTLIASAKLLFDLEDNEVTELIKTMGNSYQLHMISHKRKSRGEIVNILKNEASEVIRSAGNRMLGRT